MSSRIAAFLTYLLLVIGWAYVLVARRGDSLAMFHVRQSIILALSAIVAVIAWVVFGWVMGLVPLLGPPLSIASFALVIAAMIYLAIMWVVGMVWALQGKAQSLPIPIIGRWADRLPF